MKKNTELPIGKIMRFAVAFAFIAAAVGFASSAEAATLSFSPAAATTTVGDTFKVNVRVNVGQAKGYTVKSSMLFPSDMLEMRSWEFAPDWMSLRKPGYDMLDQAGGKMVRTAGYTNGFTGTITLGTATFRAKKAGVARLSYGGDSMVLDETSKNTHAGGGTAEIRISPGAGAPVPEPDTVPSYLLDIYLDLEQDLITKGDDLLPKVIFKNFGRLPVQMHVTFDVINSAGKNVARKMATTTIETEQILTQRFAGLNLADGNYLLRVTTVYGGGVTDEFDRLFTVGAVKKSWWPYVVAGLVLLILLIAFFRRREDEDEEWHSRKLK